MLYTNLHALINQKFKKHKVAAKDIELLRPQFTKQNVITLLNDIINQPELIKKIANRSYLHTLGFYKLVLIDSSKDAQDFTHKTQVRLHLWKPDNDSVPVVESLHEHSFDFVSTVLTGKLENQSFIREDISEDEKKVLDHLLNIIEVSNNEEKAFLESQIEILLTRELAILGSEQFKKQELEDYLDIAKVKEITKFNDSELKILVNLQGFFKSNRIAGERKDYKHILEKHISLKPYKVESIKQGDFYFHPYQLPHRLFYDNKEYNSTILVTSHIPENPEGGSFQRPTHNEEGEQDYSKKPISEKELVFLLEEYVDYLSKS